MSRVVYQSPGRVNAVPASGDVFVFKPGNYINVTYSLSGLSGVRFVFEEGALFQWDSLSSPCFDVSGCSYIDFMGADFLGVKEHNRTIQNHPAIKLSNSSYTQIVGCRSTLGSGLVQQDAQAGDVGTMVTDCDVISPRAGLRARNSAVIDNVRISWPTDVEWDRVGDSGPSHGIYLFGGSQDVVIRNCRITNCRKTGIKVSGTTLKLADIRIHNNTLVDCGLGIEVGGDGFTDGHENIVIESNNLKDCGTNRPGWNDNHAIRVLGSRSVSIARNTVRYTRENLGPANAHHSIQVSRYDANSDEVESISIQDNKLVSDSGLSPGNIGVSGILLSSVAGPAVVQGNMVTGVAGQAYRAQNCTEPVFTQNTARGVAVYSELVSCSDPRVQGAVVSAPTSQNAQIRFNGCTNPVHSDNGGASVEVI